MPNVFLADIENIGKHIGTGLLRAAPLVEKILISKPVAAVPTFGPILSELGTIFSNIEAAKTAPLTAAEVEEIVAATVAALQIKSAASSAAAATASPSFTISTP